MEWIIKISTLQLNVDIFMTHFVIFYLLKKQKSCKEWVTWEGLLPMDFKKLLTSSHVKPYLLKARYGIEKESQRVDLSGNLTKTDHPKSISIRDEHPYIQRDFSETQMELITPVTETLEELFNYLAAIHDVAYRSMDENEMLWPLSMPP